MEARVHDGSPILHRIERIEAMPPELTCPCRCEQDDEEPEMVVSVLDDGEVRCCLLCLAVGYVCRLVPDQAIPGMGWRAVAEGDGVRYERDLLDASYSVWWLALVTETATFGAFYCFGGDVPYLDPGMTANHRTEFFSNPGTVDVEIIQPMILRDAMWQRLPQLRVHEHQLRGEAVSRAYWDADLRSLRLTDTDVTESGWVEKRLGDLWTT